MRFFTFTVPYWILRVAAWSIRTWPVRDTPRLDAWWIARTRRAVERGRR